MSDAVRHGSRWLMAEPDEDEVRGWFEKQTLHDGMEHAPYLGGIVLIGATEKVKVTKAKQNGDTYVAEMERSVFVPYVKVDTRIAYFHDYAKRLSGDTPFKYIGVISPVLQTRIEDPASPYYNLHLPDGFGIMPVRNSNDSVSRFLVATYRVEIIERESPDKQPVLQGVGSKQTALARNWADDNAVMKAETGAIGRALGVAGVLVVGTGVATAEDMLEAQAGPGGAAASSGEGAVLPPEAVPQAAGTPQMPAETMDSALPPTEEQTEEEMRARAAELAGELESQHPEAWAAVQAWWAERKFGRLADLTGPALKGAVIKLERDLDAAKTEKLNQATAANL